MDFISSTRAAENRTSRWKGIVAKSSVVLPRRPSKVMGLNRTEYNIDTDMRNEKEMHSKDT